MQRCASPKEHQQEQEVRNNSNSSKATHIRKRETQLLCDQTGRAGFSNNKSERAGNAKKGGAPKFLFQINNNLSFFAYLSTLFDHFLYTSTMNKQQHATTDELPQLPIISLSTADEIFTRDLCAGRMTIIGTFCFRTTRRLYISDSPSQTWTLTHLLVTDFWTTQCVKCPAALDKLNEMATEHPDVQFVSICCDSLDGAREIVEQDDEPRWSSVQHFFMNKEDKEKAKKLLGFARVPFYVVLGEEGQIIDKGNNIDLDQHVVPEDKENLVGDSNGDDVFVIDDLDF